MKIIVEVPDGWKPMLGRLGGMIDCPIRGCQEVMMCGECQIANAKEAVEVPASKHALQLWLGNPDIELYAVKEETK